MSDTITLTSASRKVGDIYVHPIMNELYYTNTTGRLYKIIGDKHFAFTPKNTRNRLPYIVYKRTDYNIYKLIHECFTGIPITSSETIFDYPDYESEYIDPALIIIKSKSEWMKERYDNGTMAETLAKIKATLSESAASWLSKEVINTNTGTRYPSAKDASKALGLSETAVAHAIRYAHKCKGHTFQYTDPEAQRKVDARRNSLVPLRAYSRRS